MPVLLLLISLFRGLRKMGKKFIPKEPNNPDSGFIEWDDGTS